MTLENRTTSGITIFDDDAEVAFEAGVLTFSETSGTTPVTLVRNGTNTASGVALSNLDGTAVADTDYLFVPQNLTFLSGESVKEVLVGIIDDAAVGEDRSFQLSIDSIGGAALGSPVATEIVIQDNDSPGYPGLGFSWLTDAANGVRAIHVDEQGRVLAGGGFSKVNGTSATNFIRLLPNGEIDPSFDTGSGFNGVVYDIASTPDGAWLVAGGFSAYDGQPANGLVRLLDDGSPDPAFDIGAGFDRLVESVEVLADNRILVGGFFSFADTKIRSGVALLNSDGSLDGTFVPTHIPAGYTGHGATVAGDWIYAFGEISGTTTNSVMRFAEDGARDLTFMPQIGDSFQNRITGLAVQPDDRILIGGLWNQVNGVPRNNIARLHADGTLDTSFDPGLGADSWIFRILLEADGKIVLVGDFQNYDGTPRRGIARILPDGSLDTTFDPGSGTEDFTDAIFGMADGSYYLGGVFKSYDGAARFGLTRLNSDGSAVLAQPEFLSGQLGSGGTFDMEVLVEPNIDVRLLESTDFTGWSPVETNATPRRILPFSPNPSGDRTFYQSELLVP